MIASKLLFRQPDEMLDINLRGTCISFMESLRLVHFFTELHARDQSYIINIVIFFTDIEECRTETDNCHDDANCTNTKGSFYCTCLTGYSGNGVTCDGK